MKISKFHNPCNGSQVTAAKSYPIPVVPNQCEIDQIVEGIHVMKKLTEYMIA